MIWFTSDWHFNHDKPFIYESRDFSSIEEMNEIIIARHNCIVRPEDKVIVLGDLMLGGSDKLEAGIKLIERLNGHLTIIRGNHDTNKRWEAYAQLYPKIENMMVASFFKYKKYHFYLSHFPAITTNFDQDKPLKERTLSLAGHSHTKNKFQDMQYGCYHVEIDCHNLMPVSIEEIIQDYKSFWSDMTR